MTKVRAPMTFGAALLEVASLLGFDGCASVLGKSDSAVRKMSDPDIERDISIRDARRLDAAYLRAGGEGAPFLACYTLQLESAPAIMQPTVADIIDATRSCAKETGEAVAAALATIDNINCASRRADALREIEEAIGSLTNLTAKLRREGERAGDR